MTMTSNEKIKQVFNAIKENGLNAFDDESLSKLLAILNERELDDFMSRAFEELGGVDALKRVMAIRPFVEAIVNQDLYRIRTSSLFNNYRSSLEDDNYVEFLKTLHIQELADLKKYISFTLITEDENNMSGSKKIINMITRLIKQKEEAKKPRFE